jgi:hypothetical protein
MEGNDCSLFNDYPGIRSGVPKKTGYLPDATQSCYCYVVSCDVLSSFLSPYDLMVLLNSTLSLRITEFMGLVHHPVF